jgi:hypothetical protein
MRSAVCGQHFSLRFSRAFHVAAKLALEIEESKVIAGQHVAEMFDFFDLLNYRARFLPANTECFLHSFMARFNC